MAKTTVVLKKWGPLMLFALIIILVATLLSPELKDNIVKYLSF